MINIWLSGLLSGLGTVCLIEKRYKTAVFDFALALLNLSCYL